MPISSTIRQVRYSIPYSREERHGSSSTVRTCSRDHIYESPESHAKLALAPQSSSASAWEAAPFLLTKSVANLLLGYLFPVPRAYHGTTPALSENEHKPRPDRTLACSKPKAPWRQGHPMGMDIIDPRNQGISVNEGILHLSDSIYPSHPFDDVGIVRVAQLHAALSS
ncbi:unnamed protein product [Fusarium graminearum]|uniref:Chromosome 1, complete genome n=1 Tax=Gibberella zeae (strain ATCC MYA-4620 / CBS 123657 / FGSC 9075 / NRRL 31084 / PH-1) TaxID=229533 RepID=A0A098D1B9_GIBZE|nr:unnamed protein product [Fusarium graminearum]CZS75999.1 unnamed protein product [Fusarium graminearum]